MAKVCDVCGCGPQFGNRVSHAHNLTKRRWNINLQPVHAMVKGAPARPVHVPCEPRWTSREADAG